ncbi:hypothetical protein SERLA73DRAFT_130553, partial [Serpula lacrymans var. lacrymans S7.3]
FPLKVLQSADFSFVLGGPFDEDSRRVARDAFFAVVGETVKGGELPGGDCGELTVAYCLYFHPGQEFET